MSGTRGPIPKRSDMRRRRNKTDIPIDAVAARATKDYTPPEPDPEWHPTATRLYVSLAESGQSVFYEPSDWATAYLIAESISRDLHPQFVGHTDSGKVIEREIPMKGASLAAYLKAFNALMVTEGDRRRARIELERGEVDNSAEEAKIARMNDYRRAADV